MRHPRRLALRKETLAELGTGDLRNVAGGAFPTTPLNDCLEPYLSRLDQCDSLMRPCLSGLGCHTNLNCVTTGVRVTG